MIEAQRSEASGSSPSAGVFTGVAVALVTLFAADGRVDAARTAEHAARLVEQGVSAIVLSGSTGEPWFLTGGERLELARAARSVLGPRVPLILGTGHPQAAEAVRLTALAAAEGGVDAVLALSPPEDVIGYYQALAEAAGPLPVLAYHYPQISPPGIPLDALDGLPVAGLKDSSGDPERLALTLSRVGYPVYVGSALLLTLAAALGAAGAILALANVEPARCVAAWHGDSAAQRELARAHLEMRADFSRSMKRLLAERFGAPLGARRSLPAGAPDVPWPGR
jgi:4-hydroxy-tetrahydrodipicolinate synthase